MRHDATVILSMRVAGTLLWMIYTILLARTLAQSDFAIVLYAISFSLLAVLLITFGRDVALLRFASKAWATGARSAVLQMLRRSRRVVFFNGCALTFLLLGASFFGLDTPVTNELRIALLSGLLTLASAQMGLNRDCLRSLERVWQSQIGLNFTRSIIPVLGSLFVFLTGGTLSAEQALTLLLCSMLLSIFVEELFLRQVDWRCDPLAQGPDQKEVVRAGFMLWPGDIANALLMRSVGLVGALVLQPEAAALLLAAERIAGLAQYPIAATSQAASPSIARATSASNEAVQQALNRGSLLMLAGTMIGCIGAALVAWPALWALGPEYLAALPTTLVLIFASLAWAFFGLAQSALNLTGRSYQYSIISICVTAATVVSIWFAASNYGGFWAAVVWCVAWWVANIAYTVSFRLATKMDTGIFSVRHQILGYFRTRL